MTKHKLTAFIISAFFSGLAGALLVFYMGTASVGTLVSISVGVQVIIAAVLGGRRTIIGAAIGAIFLIAAGEALRPFGELSTFIVSAIALVVILFVPSGSSAFSRAARNTRDGGLPSTVSSSATAASSPSTTSARAARRRDSRPHRSERLRQIDGDEAHHGHRAADRRVRSISTASRWRTGPRTASRARASASFSSIRGRCTARPCSKTSSSLSARQLAQALRRSQVDRRAREIAARVGLPHVIDRRPGTLPFADLRRMELAKAIARDPQVVLVDEPFAGLTPTEVATFSELIRGFREDGRAVLLVDHNVKSVAALVDRVFALYLGERIAEGTAG